MCWGSLLDGSGTSCLCIPMDPFQPCSRWTLGLIKWGDCGGDITQTTHYLLPSYRTYEFVNWTNSHSNFQCYTTVYVLRLTCFLRFLFGPSSGCWAELKNQGQSVHNFSCVISQMETKCILYFLYAFTFIQIVCNMLLKKDEFCAGRCSCVYTIFIHSESNSTYTVQTLHVIRWELAVLHFLWAISFDGFSSVMCNWYRDPFVPL